MPSGVVYWIRLDCHQNLAADGYVGIASNFEARRADHLTKLLHGSHKNPVLQNAYRKYGVEALRFEVIFSGTMATCSGIENWLRPEPEIGWNLLQGGNVPPTRAGTRWFNDGIVNRSAMACPPGFWPGKMQKSGRHGLLGRPKSQEHRAKLSEALKGRPLEPERVERIRANHATKRWFTDGTVNKLASECPVGFRRGRTFRSRWRPHGPSPQMMLDFVAGGRES